MNIHHAFGQNDDFLEAVFTFVKRLKSCENVLFLGFEHNTTLNTTRMIDYFIEQNFLSIATFKKLFKETDVIRQYLTVSFPNMINKI